MASASLSTPKNAALRGEILSALRDRDQPLTARQLYAVSTMADDHRDVSSILKPMVDAGELVRAAPVPPGAPGGMPLGKGAKPVASYVLATEQDRPLAPAQPSPAVMTTETMTAEALVARPPLDDPLVAQLVRLEHPRSPLLALDAHRLRALASTPVLFNTVPDWALYLLSLADRIEESL
jgi:hypothetical protein